jgi:hypothetical protein
LFDTLQIHIPVITKTASGAVQRQCKGAVKTLDLFNPLLRDLKFFGTPDMRIIFIDNIQPKPGSIMMNVVSFIASSYRFLIDGIYSIDLQRFGNEAVVKVKTSGCETVVYG